MLFHDSFLIIEPQRGVKFMLALNTRVVQYDILVSILPLSADLFVFAYPIYLVGLYLWGIRKKTTFFKQAALTIFSSAALTAGINMVIQYFYDKSRPESAIIDKANLILKHLPTDPFPSDHAAVSAAIAMATMLRGLKYRDRRFLRTSLLFWIFCLIMSFSRVAVAIHRPTDILVGRGVGIGSALLVSHPTVQSFFSTKLFTPLIAFENKLTTLLFERK